MPTMQSSGPATATLTVPCGACGKWNRILASRAASRPKCGACGTVIGVDHPLPLDDATFDRVIASSDLPVLVDFYADWCGPCKMMAPAVDELARTTLGEVLVAKLDTDRASRTAQRYQIRGIPTVIVFKGGREAKRQSGAVSLGVLKALLQ